MEQAKIFRSNNMYLLIGLDIYLICYVIDSVKVMKYKVLSNNV